MNLHFHDDIFKGPHGALSHFLRLQFPLGLTLIERKFAITFFLGLQANVPDLETMTPGQRHAKIHAAAQQSGHTLMDVPGSPFGNRPPRIRPRGRA